jgi:hypothetical protein
MIEDTRHFERGVAQQNQVGNLQDVKSTDRVQSKDNDHLQM